MRLLTMLLCGATALSAQMASIGFTPPSVKPNGITGAPFSGEEEYVHGDKITKGRKLYRDSEGRTRTEREVVPGSDLFIVEISDPVLGALWVLDPQKKIAHLMTPQPPPMPAEPAVALVAPWSQPAASRPAFPRTPSPVSTTDTLDPDEIGGVKVVGSRTTSTYADGRKVVTESWMSPELQVFLRNKTGDDLFRMSNLSRKEPVPSLFRVPADYVIIDEKSTFVVEFR